MGQGHYWARAWEVSGDLLGNGRVSLVRYWTALARSMVLIVVESEDGAGGGRMGGGRRISCCPP